MSEEQQPCDKVRFMPHEGYVPPPGETRMGQALAKAISTEHVSGNVAAVQVVNALHVESRIAKAQPPKRMFSRPLVRASRAVSKSVTPSVSPKPK